MRNVLEKFFDQSFADFMSFDLDNVCNGVSERNLCGRLSYHMQLHANAVGLDRYFCDVEYNRMQNGRLKVMLPRGSMSEVSIVCDLILHSRGAFPGSDNLIAVEMKKSSRPAMERDADRLRLATLTRVSYDDVWSSDGVTHPEFVCGYILGYYIEIDERRRRFNLEVYESGQQSKSFSVAYG